MAYKVGTGNGGKKKGSGASKPTRVNGAKLLDVHTDEKDNVVIELEGKDKSYTLTLWGLPENQKKYLEKNKGLYLMLDGRSNQDGVRRYTIAMSKTAPNPYTLSVVDGSLPITNDHGVIAGFTAQVGDRKGQIVSIKGHYDADSKKYVHDTIDDLSALAERMLQADEKASKLANMSEEEKDELSGKEIKALEAARNVSFVVYAQDADGHLAMAPMVIAPNYVAYKKGQGEDPVEVIKSLVARNLEGYGASIDEVTIKGVEGHRNTISQSQFKGTDIKGIPVYSPRAFEPAAAVLSKDGKIERNPFTHYVAGAQVAESSGFANQVFGEMATPRDIAYRLGLDGVAPGYEEAVKQVIEVERSARQSQNTAQKAEEAPEQQEEPEREQGQDNSAAMDMRPF